MPVLGPSGLATARVRTPSIQTQTWDAIEITRADDAGVEIEPMHLIQGNFGFEFMLGVLDSETERARFAEYGLADLAPQFSSQDWSIRVPAGGIQSYYLDESEVSHAQFMQFVRSENGWNNAALWVDGPPRQEWRDFWLEKSVPSDTTIPAAPVLFDEARAYAAWVGKRLPTLAELEYAGRGGANYWPFAAAELHLEHASKTRDSIDPSVVNWNPTPTLSPRAGRLWGRQEGRDWAPSGDWPPVRNLTGNAAEWTTTPPRRHVDSLGEAARRRLACEPWSASLPAAQFPQMLVFGASARTGRPTALYTTPMRRAERHGSGEQHEFIGFRCALSRSEMLQRSDSSGDVRYDRRSEQLPNSPRK